MKKLLVFILLFSNLLCREIVVGSFNTLHLGWDGKNYTETATILSLFDIVALQEVMKKDGLIQLVKELEKVSKDKWAYHISPYPVGNGEQYNEYYAYIYKKNSISFVKSLGFYEDTTNDFIREPYAAQFKADKFDFTLINCHLIYGDKKIQRQNEAKKLSKVYDYFQNLDKKDNDVIILGDFNLPAYDDSFKTLFNHKEKIFYAIDPKFKTTLGKTSLGNSYDNFFYSFKNTTEYTGRNGVLDYTDDFIKLYGNKRYSILRAELSDHLPVYIEFETNSPSD